VGVDLGSLQADSQPKSFGLAEGRRPLGAVLHLSNEPGELSQWFCHDDSTINISICIIIIIIIISVVLELAVNSCRYHTGTKLCSWVTEAQSDALLNPLMSTL